MKDMEFNILAFSRNKSRRSGWRAVERYLAARRAPATEAAYEACLGAFKAWAGEARVSTAGHPGEQGAEIEDPPCRRRKIR